MKKSIKEVLAFKELSEEEKKARGILGRLYGPCASFTVPTRNGRKYSDELWDKVFDSELVKEAFENGGIFGELDHPTDRTETCSEKIAICMPERPKKDDDGHLIAYFDILDTPNGRIAYALAKYGYKLGISSRGNGDVYEDDDGNESVDPDTYDFTCFDLVITPSVKDARLSMTESLDTNKNTFEKELLESFNKSNEDDKKVMRETLKDLNIKLECNDENRTDKLEENFSKAELEKTQKEVENIESKKLIESLQEALKDKSKLQAQIRDLNEKLAVSNAKVDQMSEDLKKARSAMISANNQVSKMVDLSDKVSKLEESLKEKQTAIEQAKNLNEKLSKDSEKNSADISSLNEALSQKDSKIKELTEKLDVQTRKNAEEAKELNSKLTHETKLKESYKKLAYSTVNRYIDSKALMLGVTSNEIRNKLDKNYNIDDIDRICEDLQNYQISVNRLPFNLDKKVKVKVTESRNDPLHADNPDDDFDAAFLDGLLPG